MELNPIEEVLANTKGPYRRASDGAWCINTLYLRKRSGYKYRKFLDQVAKRIDVKAMEIDCPPEDLRHIALLPQEYVGKISPTLVYVFTEDQFNAIYPLAKNKNSEGIKFMIDVMFKNAKAAAAEQELLEEERQQKQEAADDQQLDLLSDGPAVEEDWGLGKDPEVKEEDGDNVNYDHFAQQEGSLYVKIKRILSEFYYPSEGMDLVYELYSSIKTSWNNNEYLGIHVRRTFLDAAERALINLRREYRTGTSDSEFETAVLVDFDTALSRLAVVGRRQARRADTNARKALLMNGMPCAQGAHTLGAAALREHLDGLMKEVLPAAPAKAKKPVLSDAQQELISELRTLTAEAAKSEGRQRELIHGTRNA